LIALFPFLDEKKARLYTLESVVGKEERAV
jgi:hypothetical protein